MDVVDVRYGDLEVNAPTEWASQRSGAESRRDRPVLKHQLCPPEREVGEPLVAPLEDDLESDESDVERHRGVEVCDIEFGHE